MPPASINLSREYPKSRAFLGSDGEARIAKQVAQAVIAMKRK
jgi:hypothetical protein